MNEQSVKLLDAASLDATSNDAYAYDDGAYIDVSVVPLLAIDHLWGVADRMA